MITDVLNDEGGALAEELRHSGHPAAYRHLDVADEDAWSACVGEVMGQFGRLDVLVNNAGIGTFEDCETETLEATGDIGFLAGEGASFMTGSEVYADGGWTAR